MSETIETGDAPEVPWVTSGPRMRVADISTLPGAGAAMHESAKPLGKTRDEWADGLRGTVRNHPLAAMAAAVALGAVIVRVIR